MPLDVDVFRPGDVVAPLMLNAAVSPLRPSTHAFWNVTGEVVRVLVTVQVTEPDAGAVNVAVFAPLVQVIVAPVHVNALTEYAPTLLAPNTSARLTVDPAAPSPWPRSPCPSESRRSRWTSTSSDPATPTRR